VRRAAGTWLLLAAILLALAGVAANLVLFVPWFFQRALGAANAVLPVRVEVASYRHVPGELRLGGVRVSNERGPVGSVRSLSLAYEILPLFLGRVRVRSLTADGVRMFLERTPDGRLNLAGLVPPETGEGRPGKPFRPEALLTWAPFPLDVHRLEVSDGAVEYADAAAGFLLTAAGVELAGSLSTGPYRARLRWVRGHVLWRGEGREASLAAGVEGSARIRDGVMELAGFRLSLDPGAVELNGSWDLKPNRMGLKADLDSLPLEKILEAWGIAGVRVNGLSGRVQADAQGCRDASAVAALKAGAYGHPVQADLKGSVADGVVRLDALSVKEAEATLSGTGTLDPATGAVTGTVRVEAPVLEEVFRAHGYPGQRVDGLLVDAQIAGTLQDPDVRAAVSARQWSSGSEPFLKQLAAAGSYRRQEGLRLSGTAAESPLLSPDTPGPLSFSVGLAAGVASGTVDAGSALRLCGAVHLEPRRAEISFAARRLHLTGLARFWAPDLSLATLTGEGSFQGDLRDRLSWQGKAEMEDVSVSMPDASLRVLRAARVRLNAGTLELALTARLNGEPLDIQGTVPIVAGRAMALEGRASLALAPFQGLIASRVPSVRACQGTLRLEGRVTGTAASPVVRASLDIRDGRVGLARPQGAGAAPDAPGARFLDAGFDLSADLQGPLKALEGRVSLQARDASVYGVPLDEVAAELRGDGSRWSAEQVRAAAPWGSLSLEGWWEPATDGISGRLRSTAWPLREIFAALQVPAAVDGQLEVQGTVGGRLRDPRLDLEVPVEGLAVEGHAYGHLEGRLGLDGGRLETRWRMDAGEVAASLDLAGSRQASLRVSLREFSLGPVMDAWKGDGWQGRISVDGSLEGPVRDPWGWSGQVALAGLDLTMADVSFRLADPVTVSFAPGEVVIPAADLLFEDSSLRLQGTLGREIRFSARGTVDLAPFVALLPWANLEEGTARVDLRVGGTFADPDLRGTVRVDARDLSFPAFAFPVERLTADLEGSGSELELKSFRATVGEGSLEAHGKVDLDPFSVSGMDLTLATLPLSVSDALSGTVQGKLRFQGNGDASVLQGSVRIVQARYEQDFDLLGTVLSPRRPTLRAQREPAAFLRNMRLDVRVRSGPDLYVRNNISRMILSMDMNLRGTAVAMAPEGRVKALRGDVYFSDKEFQITRGSLVFLGTPKAYPTLQLESKTTIQGKYRDYRVFLTMDGPLDRIELTLSSIPALSREDILFVLFTGMTQEQYFATPTDFKGTGAGLAASGVAALVGKDVKAWTGLDTFEMGGYEGTGAGVKATLGKRVGERMEIRGTLSVGEQLNRGEAQVEYELADGFYLVGTQRTDGSFGLDLRFRFVGR